MNNYNFHDMLTTLQAAQMVDNTCRFVEIGNDTIRFVHSTKEKPVVAVICNSEWIASVHDDRVQLYESYSFEYDELKKLHSKILKDNGFDYNSIKEFYHGVYVGASKKFKKVSEIFNFLTEDGFDDYDNIVDLWNASNYTQRLGLIFKLCAEWQALRDVAAEYHSIRNLAWSMESFDGAEFQSFVENLLESEK